MYKNITPRVLCLALLGIAFSRTVSAASDDEIQVYNDAINKPGQAGLDVHMNYVVSGVKTPEWQGDVPAHHSGRVTPEFSYAVTPEWELGAYLLMLRQPNGVTSIDGTKARIKYIAPHGDEGFYWGTNEELGVLSSRSSEAHWNLEVRPIFGYRIQGWNLTVNPILEIPLSGLEAGSADFTPAFRAVYALKENFTTGLEHYADLGSVSRAEPNARLSQVTYVVGESEVGGYSLHLGVGKGWNAASDKLTVKAILGARF